MITTTEIVPILLELGVLGIFIWYTLHLRSLESDEQNKWREFYEKQFEIIVETNRNISALLGDYARVIAGITEGLKENTEAIIKLNKEK